MPGATFTVIERLPDDPVGALLFLCSPGAAFVTGQALAIDGGATHP